MRLLYNYNHGLGKKVTARLLLYFLQDLLRPRIYSYGMDGNYGSVERNGKARAGWGLLQSVATVDSALDK